VPFARYASIRTVSELTFGGSVHVMRSVLIFIQSQKVNSAKL
jgi:hypothetical protein